jgi:hypothetical protein
MRPTLTPAERQYVVTIVNKALTLRGRRLAALKNCATALDELERQDDRKAQARARRQARKAVR